MKAMISTIILFVTVPVLCLLVLRSIVIVAAYVGANWQAAEWAASVLEVVFATEADILENARLVFGF